MGELINLGVSAEEHSMALVNFRELWWGRSVRRLNDYANQRFMSKGDQDEVRAARIR